MFQNCKIRGVGCDSREYHEGNGASRGDKDFEASSGMLRDFGHCARRWRDGYQPPETDAQAFGSLVDCLVLTPNQFQAHYAVRPETYKNDKGEIKEWNNNATVCREWNSAAKQSGQDALKQAELTEAQTAVKRLRADPILAAFMDASDKQAWVQGEWHDEPTGLVIPCKALVDIAPRDDSDFAACLGDLKTTRSAKPGVWSRFSSERGYHLQAAFYLDLWNSARGQQRDTWCFVLCENFPPYQTGRAMLSVQKLEYGRILYRAYLARYAQCLVTGNWPDYNFGPGVIDGWSLDIESRWDEMEAMAALDTATKPEPAPEEPDPDNSEEMN